MISDHRFLRIKRIIDSEANERGDKVIIWNKIILNNK
jgi:hypothetical protein